MSNISVIMPVFNVESYIDLAVHSILEQTVSDFEFLIIDDGSQDSTWARLETLARQDRRLRLWRNESNLGLAKSANYLVPLSVGKYIARMDGDDIAVPDRFEKQMKILESGVADLCGGWIMNFGDGGDKVLTFPLNDAQIQMNLLFDWSVLHPTIMMRRQILEQTPYRAGAVPATDFDFLVRAAGHCKMYNLPEILLYRRMHGGQVSERMKAARFNAKMAVCALALSNAGIHPTDQELRLHAHIHEPALPETWADVEATNEWLDKLNAGLKQRQTATEFLSVKWYRYCLRSTVFGLRTYRLFRGSSLRGHPRPAFIQEFILFALCLFRIKYQSGIYRLLFTLTKDGRRLRRATEIAIRRKSSLMDHLGGLQSQ